MKYDVMPRYSAGSPAWVDQGIALGVIRDERRAIAGYLEGFYGEEGKQRAEREGLEGIVIFAEGRRSSPSFVDAITGRKYGDLPYDAIRYASKIVEQKKTGVVNYYYRRELLVVLHRRRVSEDNMLDVFKALDAKYGMAYSAELHDLWVSRRQV